MKKKVYVKYLTYNFSNIVSLKIYEDSGQLMAEFFILETLKDAENILKRLGYNKIGKWKKHQGGYESTWYKGK